MGHPEEYIPRAGRPLGEGPTSLKMPRGACPATPSLTVTGLDMLRRKLRWYLQHRVAEGCCFTRTEWKSPRAGLVFIWGQGSYLH